MCSGTYARTLITPQTLRFVQDDIYLLATFIRSTGHHASLTEFRAQLLRLRGGHTKTPRSEFRVVTKVKPTLDVFTYFLR